MFLFQIFFSDDNDILDSDPEIEIPQKPIEIFKDQTVTPTKIQSPVKPKTPVKRIDLGAAAHYGKQTQQPVINPTISNQLNTETSSVDLFNLEDNSNKPSNEFGDFSTASSTVNQG